MGCTESSGTFGPKSKLDLLNLEERDSDGDILEENEFPYMSGRLKNQDYKSIIAKGEPWIDPSFTHPGCLYANRKAPAKKGKEKWATFEWKRASEYFGEGNFEVFDGVDPTDIIMGNCNNCYAFAALSGIAEATADEITKEEKGERIKDNFLTREVNAAGCYAI